MAKKTAKRQTKLNKQRVVSVVVAALIGLMVLNLCGRVFNLYERKTALEAAKREETALTQECERLSKELELLDDEDYLTRYARGHWVFTKDGETVIPLPKDAASDSQE